MTGEADIRDGLLRNARRFALDAAGIAGVLGIALIGSILTGKRSPKDIDLLVTIDEAADLAPLALVGRRLMGHCQSLNRGADVFLADSAGRYLGRLCRWRRCAPFARGSCRALTCGRQEFLNDDLPVVTLSPDLVREPPLGLFPRIIRRAQPPADVEAVLLAGLWDKPRRRIDK